MSEYTQYLSERNDIDGLLQKGYVICSVKEDLNGSVVEFINKETKLKEVLIIKNANARKYFSSMLLQQKQVFRKQC
ncbi:MAG: hypothetical protein ACI35P_11090 [Bacillus sp. (in: firmicutes)]